MRAEARNDNITAPESKPMENVITVRITAATTLAPVAQKVQADASGGSFPVTFPPCAKWLGQAISVANVGTGNLVTWRLNDDDSADELTADGVLVRRNAGAIAPGQIVTLIATEA